MRVRIEPGAVIRECILGNYTRVTSVARLEQALILAQTVSILPESTSTSKRRGS